MTLEKFQKKFEEAHFDLRLDTTKDEGGGYVDETANDYYRSFYAGYVTGILEADKLWEKAAKK